VPRQRAITVLMDEELLIRNTQKHWHDCIEAA
jgi:hypothetical protein